MATTVYRICEAQSTEAAETWFDFDSLGISKPAFEFVCAGTDRCTLRVTGQTAFTDSTEFEVDEVTYNLFQYKKVLRIARSIDGGSTEYLFLGRVDHDPYRGMDGLTEHYSITILGMWDWFEHTPMRQDWVESSSVTVSKPRAILFCGPAGARMTTGAQIQQCIAVARTGGCPVATPTTGDIISGFTPPFDEVVNISVAQAVIKALVNHPHAAAWFDYSQREPVMYVKSRAALTAVNVDIAGRRDIFVSPRNDQVPPCIALCFEKSVTVNGASSVATNYDYAPLVAGETESETAARLQQVDAIWGVYNLDGSSTSFKKQKIVVEALSKNGDWMTSKAWWKAAKPELGKYADADITLSNPTMAADETQSLPNILKEGTVQPWMDKEFERQRFMIDAKLTRRVNGYVTDVKKHNLSIELPMTDATSKTYREQNDYDPGESIPTGVAAALYDEFSQLHYDCTFTLIDQEPEFNILPGKAVNFINGITAWTTMAAMVSRVSIDLDTGATACQVGFPKWLDLDSRVAWFRNCNQRQAAWSRIYRDEPDTSVDGTQGFPNVRDAQISDENYRKRFVNDGNPVHSIDINPGDITGASARAMKPREIKTLEASSTTPTNLTQKKRQIMATDAYDEETVNLPEGGSVADFDVITGVSSFVVDGSQLKIVFSTKNTVTGDAGDDVTATLDLPEVTVVTETGYASTSFNRTKRTLRVLAAGTNGSAIDYVDLVSHASQHSS